MAKHSGILFPVVREVSSAIVASTVALGHVRSMRTSKCVKVCGEGPVVCDGDLVLNWIDSLYLVSGSTLSVAASSTLPPPYDVSKIIVSTSVSSGGRSVMRVTYPWHPCVLGCVSIEVSIGVSTVTGNIVVAAGPGVAVKSVFVPDAVADRAMYTFGDLSTVVVAVASSTVVTIGLVLGG